MELRMEMKSWKLLASGVFVACSISASALDLAALDGNVPRYTIIGDNSKGMSPLYAARELRDYILKITGHEIGVTNSKGPGIVTKTILISIVDDPALGDDGFRIKAKKDGNGDFRRQARRHLRRLRALGDPWRRRLVLKLVRGCS